VSEAALVPLIAELLAARQPAWGALEIRRVAGGIEFDAFALRTEHGEPLFLRAAAERFSSNDNDPQVDARRLLAQEAAIAELLGRSQVPIARVRELVVDDRLDLLVTDWVEDDGSDVRDADVLRLLSHLHAIPLPALELVAQEHPSAAATVAHRTARRLETVARLADLEDAPIPAPDALRAAAELPGESLLHLDVRRANMRVRGTELGALVDWTNALVGPPALEYARLAEYGEVDVPSSCFDGVPEPAELVFRLDAAVMLAVVFLSEAPSPDDAARQVARVRDLLRALGR
jgi:aminoglycoside phosphotransferase (APT) family kinase protein